MADGCNWPATACAMPCLGFVLFIFAMATSGFRDLHLVTSYHETSCLIKNTTMVSWEVTSQSQDNNGNTQSTTSTIYRQEVKVDYSILGDATMRSTTACYPTCQDGLAPLPGKVTEEW